MAFASWDAEKDPQAIRDYGVDWAADLGALTIATSTWTVVSGSATIVSDNKTATTTTVRITGGTDGAKTTFLNHIVLSDGQEDEKTCVLKVKAQ
jgi:hypothetical protein